LGGKIVVCAKVRDGDKRVVRVTDGEPKDLDVVIVDDLVQVVPISTVSRCIYWMKRDAHSLCIFGPFCETGGTLHECGAALRTLGARSVSAYVAHGVFPNDAWKRFCRGDGDKSPRGDRAVFTNFWVTNSIPTTTRNLPTDDVRDS
jgi:phosphoribosylpyrophosphate synthetase